MLQRIPKAAVADQEKPELALGKASHGGFFHGSTSRCKHLGVPLVPLPSQTQS